MFFDNRDLLGRSIFQDTYGAVLDPLRPLERGIERKRIEQPHAVLVHDMQEPVENRIARFLLARQVHRLQSYLVRGPVAHQDFAVAVVNEPALGHKLHTAQAVVLGALQVFVVMRILQGIEPNQEHREQDNHGGHEHQHVPVSGLDTLVILDIKHAFSASRWTSGKQPLPQPWCTRTRESSWRRTDW